MSIIQKSVFENTRINMSLWQQLEDEPQGTPDLSDLMLFDHTQPVEDRQDGLASEFDEITIKCDDGFTRTGIVTDWDANTVTIETNGDEYAEYYEHTAARSNGYTVSSRAMPSNWEQEYNAYLDEQQIIWEQWFAVALWAEAEAAA